MTIAALTACALGIPLPVQVEKHAAEAFPCMNCPCGCKNAEACWQDCCCYTQQEKLAWARDNGIIPPAFVLAAAEQESRQQETASCCCKRTCCSAKAKPNAGSDSQADQQPKRKRSRSASSTVMIIQALRCQGLTSSLTLLPPSILPHLVVHGLLSPPSGEVLVRNDLSPPGPFSAPETPPPQNA